jgi:hypothetical protein
LWLFSSMKCVLMIDFKVYVWVWHMIDEFIGSWWWGKSDKILLKVCEFKFCWKSVFKPTKPDYHTKTHEMHIPSQSHFCWQQFRWDFEQQIMDIVFWWGGQSRPTYWSICFQYDCYILTQVLVFDMIVFTLVYELFSPLHYCYNNNRLSINHRHVFVLTQWHCLDLG